MGGGGNKEGRWVRKSLFYWGGGRVKESQRRCIPTKRNTTAKADGLFMALHEQDQEQHDEDEDDENEE